MDRIDIDLNDFLILSLNFPKLILRYGIDLFAKLLFKFDVRKEIRGKKIAKVDL